VEVNDLRTYKELQAFIADGGKPEYHFFWMGPFSQWNRRTFTIAGIDYPTAEHWMMAEKARLFEDEIALEGIMQAAHPVAAKEFGRKVVGFNAEAWDQVCMDVVVSGNLAKFEQNPDIKYHLLETEGLVLVEASPDDRIWGIGLGTEDPLRLDPANWKGKNYLGFALMEVRKILSQL
jgi:ribA/ribD-fused uncharacterized protein